MWKLDEKCNYLAPSGHYITDCKIVWLSKKTKSVKVENEITGCHWFADQRELFCFYKMPTDTGLVCTWQPGENAPCETCPRKQEAQSIDI